MYDALRVRENSTCAHFVRVVSIFARLPWYVNAVDFLVSSFVGVRVSM